MKNPNNNLNCKKPQNERKYITLDYFGNVKTKNDVLLENYFDTK